MATNSAHDSIAELDLKEKQEIVADLGAEGFLLRDVERAVEQTFRPGDTFSDNFRRGLETLTLWRRSGAPVRAKIPIQKIKVGAPQRATAPPIASDPPGIRPPRTERRGAESTQGIAPAAPAAAEGAQDRAHTPTQATHSAQTSTPPPQKEKNMPAKICACGCGTPLSPGTVFNYVRGHKQKPPDKKGRDGAASEPAPPQAAGHKLPPVTIGNGNGADPRHRRTVPCQVSEFVMDGIWGRLSVEEKARILFPETEPTGHA